jgi:hypothetical protein
MIIWFFLFDNRQNFPCKNVHIYSLIETGQAKKICQFGEKKAKPCFSHSLRSLNQYQNFIARI